VLLLGVFLAALVFVVVLLGGNRGPGQTGGPGASPTAVTQVTVLVAAADIPLGTIVDVNMFTTKTLAVNLVEGNAYGDPSQAIGKTTRKAILTGQQVHSTDFQNRAVPITVPQGRRAITIEVSQMTGVADLLDVGDSVDLIISLDQRAFPTVQVLADGSVTIVAGLNPLTVKLPLLLQDVQIIGTIDPPPPPAPVNAQGQPVPVASVPPQVNADERKLLVLAVTPQQAEVILFARTNGTLDAVLRSPLDAGTTVETTGIILKTLVDQYGILPPAIVQVPIPTPLP
jgi:pilus assembly protein CpaB